MKNTASSFLIIAGFVSSILLFSNFTVKETSPVEKNSTTATLSKQEKTNLLTLREEEKLARDVYLYAYEKYNLPIFNNISKSEQYHMDRVLEILKANNISDPASTKKGIFKNAELQKLYTDLTTKVDVSLTEALKVGATIEDLDINDIEKFKNNSNAKDISEMYNLLACGSRNHMRAFHGQLNFRKITYEPQFISKNDYKSIIEGEHERCFYTNN